MRSANASDSRDVVINECLTIEHVMALSFILFSNALKIKNFGSVHQVSVGKLSARLSKVWTSTAGKRRRSDLVQGNFESTFCVSRPRKGRRKKERPEVTSKERSLIEKDITGRVFAISGLIKKVLPAVVDCNRINQYIRLGIAL